MIVVAHRGASGHAPENTPAALRLARTQGAHMAEIDVRMTADGEFVAVHDPTLRRTTDVVRVFPGRRSWRVSDFTLAETRRLDAGSWFDRRFSGQPVPTLEEALETLRTTGLGALVELKVERRVPETCRRLAACLRADPYWRRAAEEGRLILQSFDSSALRFVAASLPGLRVAVLGKTYGRVGLLRAARYAHLVNPHHLLVTAPYVRQVHAEGLAVFGWTANNEHTIRRLVRDGVDGIITDFPERIAASRAVAA